MCYEREAELQRDHFVKFPVVMYKEGGLIGYLSGCVVGEWQLQGDHLSKDIVIVMVRVKNYLRLTARWSRRLGPGWARVIVCARIRARVKNYLRLTARWSLSKAMSMATRGARSSTVTSKSCS